MSGNLLQSNFLFNLIIWKETQYCSKQYTSKEKIKISVRKSSFITLTLFLIDNIYKDIWGQADGCDSAIKSNHNEPTMAVRTL